MGGPRVLCVLSVPAWAHHAAARRCGAPFWRHRSRAPASHCRAASRYNSFHPPQRLAMNSKAFPLPRALAHMAMAVACLTAASGAMATPEVDALGNCIAERTTGKDRKDLAQWLFVAMSAHPEMKAISKVDPAAGEATSRRTGELLTRLLTDACRDETKAALKAGGTNAIQAAFTTLGKLAMQELTADKDVAAAMSALERHLDRKKFEALGE